MIKKKLSGRKSLLALKQGLLLQQEKELCQEEALLRRQLQDLPAAVETKRKHQEVHRYTRVVRRATFISGKLPGMFSGKSPHRPTCNLPAKGRQAAKTRFVILVLILASMVVLIWRAIPS
ncbi:hypothetical protein [Candidatus Xiphinematobacter sp. Idaho Grape]|uniref:hypothetical protein n=1 Tax=Candidatus Xiphinematobacter sp. Idaho Grape TaxID=1704307 RepID=UPI000780926D|nr:hypothetical protein [Candidatus Xiphinematobacter sp. Idaho Grape]